MNFPRFGRYYTGEVVFATETEHTETMTFGGQTYLNSEVVDSDILTKPIVNPFLTLKMSQISFHTVLLQENQIFVTNFLEQISLTPAMAATHVPESIYDYMDENFFRYLCSD